MLTDVPAQTLLSQHEVQVVRTWWLAAIHPEMPGYYRACVACGSLDSAQTYVDLDDVIQYVHHRTVNNLQQQGCVCDAVWNTFHNIIYSADCAHSVKKAADVAFCKICYHNYDKGLTQELLPLQTLMLQLRTLQCASDKRAMDIRIVHKLCTTLADLNYGVYQNPYLYCFYEAERNLIRTIASKNYTQVRGLIANFFLNQNINSKYLGSKAVEFIRQHTAGQEQNYPNQLTSQYEVADDVP